MKTLKWILLAVLMIGVGVSTVRLHTRSHRPLVMEANDRDQLAKRNEGGVYHPSIPATVPIRKLARAVPLTSEKIETPAAGVATKTDDVMRVRADQVLAKVNERAILLADLVPLQPNEREQSMSAEEYESRLTRAIEMELTFQAAATQGVGLTPAQKKRVEGIALRHDATLQEFKKQGVTWSSTTLAQLEFEQRLTSALLLQQNLVAMEAHVAPASAASVQARYEQARSKLVGRLKAQGNVSVSTIEL